MALPALALLLALQAWVRLAAQAALPLRQVGQRQGPPLPAAACLPPVRAHVWMQASGGPLAQASHRVELLLLPEGAAALAQGPFGEVSGLRLQACAACCSPPLPVTTCLGCCWVQGTRCAAARPALALAHALLLHRALPLAPPGEHLGVPPAVAGAPGLAVGVCCPAPKALLPVGLALPASGALHLGVHPLLLLLLLQPPAAGAATGVGMGAPLASAAAVAAVTPV